MQYQWRNHGHGFNHDAIGNNCSQRGYAIVIGKAEGDTDRKNQWHVCKDGTACFCHNMRYNGGQPAEIRGTDAQQNTCDRQYGYRQHQRFTDLCRLANAFLNIIESAPEYGCFLRSHAWQGESLAVYRASKRPLFITQSKIIQCQFV